MNKSAIVIGAGVGGLSAATELAARGVDVTLLERHATPGGKMRRLTVDGAGIDSGPTVFTMRWIFDDLFNAIGENLAEHLTLEPVERLARHSWPDGNTLDLYADVDRSVDAIESFAGAREAQAYRHFAAQSQRIFETLDHTFMRTHKPNPVQLTFSLGLRGIPRLYATQPFSSLVAFRSSSTTFSGKTWHFIKRYLLHPSHIPPDTQHLIRTGQHFCICLLHKLILRCADVD
ncbi:MAG: FAD-dependent oxidoreductase [Pseudomonadota bacterium]